MIVRCYKPGGTNYRYYGGRGIYVCERWRASVVFFVKDMGERPSPKHSLDRIDAQGNYTCGHCEDCQTKGQPPNCRWATKAVQSRNQRNNRYYTHDGKTLILKDWAKLAGIKYLTLWNRLNIGVPFAQAISAGLYDRKALRRPKPSSSE